MGASAGAIGTGVIAAIVGTVIMIAGVALFMTEPLFTAEHEQQNPGLLGLDGSSSSSSASLNLTPVLGLVFVIVGAVVLVVGLKGTASSFERGKERDEGTKHTLVTERR